MVGIGVLTLVPGEVGGTETYVRSLLRALSEHGALEYVAFVPPVAPDAADGLRTVVVPEYRRARTIPERLVAMAWAAARPGPLRQHFARVDVVHYPLTVPLPSVAVPSAITLQDVQHLDIPGLFSRAERMFRRVAYDRAAQRADVVIVPTEFVQATVQKHLGIGAERVRVIPYGVDHERFTPDSSVEREPFLLYPARPWPHKNHERLFAAFELVRRERPEFTLVLTGGGHDARALPPGVKVRGLVSGDELLALYRRAACLVFPSLYEGFGWPPLEAMACGCPVAASTAGSLPEVCGDAAVSFDSTSTEQIAAGILEALDRADELVPLGLARAALFTWERSAREHDAVYRELGATPECARGG